jgi:hypothetical protein
MISFLRSPVIPALAEAPALDEATVMFSPKTKFGPTRPIPEPFPADVAGAGLQRAFAQMEKDGKQISATVFPRSPRELRMHPSLLSKFL